MSGEGTGETAALRKMPQRAVPGSRVIGDAIYEDDSTWAALARADCFGVFDIDGSRALPRRIPKRLTLERSRRPIWMSKDYALIPERIERRVVPSKRANSRHKYLITSLLDKSAYPNGMIVESYSNR